MAVIMYSAGNEFQFCDFGDKRITKRLMNFAQTISNNLETSINAACGHAKDSKAAYRLLKNPKIKTEQILQGHIDNTIQRIKNDPCDHILIIQDTTDLIYTQFPSVEGLGKNHQGVDYESPVRGLMLHNSLALAANGIPLGLLKQTYFTSEDYEKKREVEGLKDCKHKNVPVEFKKSFRWLEHFEETQNLVDHLNKTIIHIADREANIYDLLHKIVIKSGNYIIRSSWNRRTQEGLKFHDTDNLENKLNNLPPAGIIKICKDRKEYQCTIKFTEVSLKPPQRLPGAKKCKFAPISTSIVEILGKEKYGKQIYWRLLSNLPCKSLEEALKIIDYYTKRWPVESFHRILKSGFGVENARLKSRSRLEVFSSIISVVSWHIFWLYHLGRICPKLSVKEFLDPISLKVLNISAKNIGIKTSGFFSIKKGVLIIARLGGFIARKSDGPPGMKSIWRGWRNLQERLEFYDALRCG